MASKPKTQIGDRHHRLTVIARAGELDANKGVRWLCQCDCGNEKVVSGGKLRDGTIKSCGCFRREMHGTHGDAARGAVAPEYRVWAAMIGRCTRPKDKRWMDYGGRGIAVCDRWRLYENFLADLGRKPSPKHTIDRIDANGHYEPGNCRWATMTEQQNNRRNNLMIEWQGRTMSAAQWERELGFRRGILHDRIRNHGWPIERAMRPGPRQRTRGN